MILFTLAVFIISTCLVCITSLVVKLNRRRNIAVKNDESVKLFIRYINSIRYGKLNDKIECKKLNGIYKTLAMSINRMSETLCDRENMVREYEKIMLEKNQSLEQFVKKEHDMHALRQDFIATLGHDLKVPILAEANTFDFLLDGTFGELNSKQVEVIEKMKSSNAELIELVENILATYKSEEQSLIPDKHFINLNTLVSAVVNDLNQFAERNQQVIHTRFKDNIEINIDAFQIKRVIKNLLFNSMTYCEKHAEIIISISKENNVAILKVTDFGPGIDAENLPHVFEKYYSCAKKFRKVGTGLGLYLAKQIITAHKGTIEVQSTPFERTEFTIKLPL